MDGLSATAAWVATALLALVALALLRRHIGRLLGVLLRSAVGLVALAVASAAGGLFGVTLGVNLANALVLGVLGVPGLGLLLMVNWVLQV